MPQGVVVFIEGTVSLLVLLCFRLISKSLNFYAAVSYKCVHGTCRTTVSLHQVLARFYAGEAGTSFGFCGWLVVGLTGGSRKDKMHI